MYFTLAIPNNSFMEIFFLISLGREGQKINMSSVLEKWVDGGKGHTHYKNTISLKDLRPLGDTSLHLNIKYVM